MKLNSTIYDIAVIGGGPVGLFAGALAGEMGAKCVIMESRCQLGGIMMAAYPDKDVYNFPGIPAIRGRELIEDLISKVKTYGVDTRQGEYADQLLDDGDGSLIIRTNRDEYISRAIIMTTGLRAHISPLVEYINIEDWDGTGIYENWPSLDDIKNKALVLLCGIAGEFRLPDESYQAAPGLTIISDQSALAGQQIKLSNTDGIKIEIFNEPWKIQMITGSSKPSSMAVRNEETGEVRNIKVDIIVGFYQGQSRQTLFSDWGIEMIGQNIKVDQKMQTNKQRIFAAGDIAWYPGKIKLLSAGIHEVKIALKNILKVLKKINSLHEVKGKDNVG